MSKEYRKLYGIKKIGGINFTVDKYFNTKTEAKSHAAKLRKQGYLARTFESVADYGVLKSTTRRRKK